MYRYALLRTAAGPQAEAHNATCLGGDVLGIEVTSEIFAERCGYGNIDPQHSKVPGESSAVEDAMSFPLPPNGALLTTERVDRDAICAMAVLYLRAIGRGDRIDRFLVDWIGAIDRYGYTNAIKKHRQLAEWAGSPDATVALNVIARNDSEWQTLEQKVLDTALILTGDMQSERVRSIAAKKRYNPTNFPVKEFGSVAVVRAPGEYLSARDWANSLYPVALIIDDEYEGNRTRYTVVRQEDHFDRRGFEDAVNALEARKRDLNIRELRRQRYTWGGTNNIVSSQPGEGCETALTESEVIDLVLRHAENGILT